jgi:hypothetical protein
MDFKTLHLNTCYLYIFLSNFIGLQYFIGKGGKEKKARQA